MGLEGLLGKASYIDTVLLASVIVALIVVLLRRREAKKVGEMTRELAALQKQLNDLQEQFQHGSESLKEGLKEVLFDKTRGLAQRVTELAKNMTEIRHRNEAMITEVEGKVDPLKASFNESVGKLDASHDAMRKMIWDTSAEVKRLSARLNAFAQEVKKMKDFVRERSIDLEL